MVEARVTYNELVWVCVEYDGFTVKNYAVFQPEISGLFLNEGFLKICVRNFRFHTEPITILFMLIRLICGNSLPEMFVQKNLIVLQGNGYF